ncbi:MAG: prepilin-type N-terminal cleavage/methylation domain-containing protein [Proteobacteria bacterium]|nr:prepilin-type N-terminal cleavage/methylation domain-containing protein [Pseudomonadota bacterium]
MTAPAASPRRQAARGRDASRRRGFTLIEIMAVVLIMGLLASFVGPNFEALRRRRLQDAGERLAAQLELERHRSLVTGVPHRVLVDLDEVAYRVEWLGGGESGLPVRVDLESLDLRGASPLPLAAPPRRNREFEPIPGLFGRFERLPDPLVFAGLETLQGWTSRGESTIDFFGDGSASPAEIVIEDASGDRIVLAVLPLDDAVRFIDEDA